jgi:exodeoxyribonuclease VII large subunit
LSPLRVLERGFSLTVGPDGHLVTNAAQLRPGDAVRVRLNQGELDAEVREVRAADAERKP